MKEIEFFFDYDEGLLTVKDSEGNAAWHIPSKRYPKDDPSNNTYIYKIDGELKAIHYNKNYPLAVYNSVLFKCYPFKEGVQADLFSQFAKPDDELDDTNAYMIREIHKVKDHLNENTLKRFPSLQILEEKADTFLKQGLYRFSPAINEYKIKWKIKCSDPYKLEQYGIDKSWTSETKQAEIDQAVASYSNNEVQSHKRYEVDSIEDKTFWQDSLWDLLLSKYEERVFDLDERLLPRVKAADTTDKNNKNLPEYFCGTYVNRGSDLSQGSSFAIVDGGSGAGKTYAMYETARRLLEDGHRAMVIELPDLYSKSGKNSLIDYICQFTNGNDSEDNVLRLRDLLSEPAKKKNDKPSKIVFLIDGIDEVYSLKLESFANELKEIAAIKNPDILFLLSVRNVEDFISGSKIAEGEGAFRRWDNITVQPLDESNLSAKDRDIIDILRENPLTRTPLFVRYYKEVRSYFKNNENNQSKPVNSSISILDSYAAGITGKTISKINNYYDLFNAKMELLCAHARKDNVNQVWYTAVLPCLAYYMYRNDIRFFDIQVLETLFSADSFGREYRWFNSKIREEYGAFRVLFSNEKLQQLLGTGIVKSETDGNGCRVYRFEHRDFQEFLAAKFLSAVVRKIDDLDVRDAVLEDVNTRTSLHLENRIEKMRHIPFARYMFIDVMRNEPIADQTLNAAAKIKKCYRGLEDFDPLLYKIAANVTFEGRDVYDEAEKLTSVFMEYENRRVTKRSQQKEIKEFDDWKLLNAANVLSYMMITKRNKDPKKWDMLNVIYDNLRGCATVLLRDAFTTMENKSKHQNRKLTKEFPYSKEKILAGAKDLAEIINNSKTAVTDINGAPVELFARIMSNLGAVSQERAKYINAHRDTVIEGAESKECYLQDAKDFHEQTLNFREAVIHSISSYIEGSKSFSEERLAEEKEYLESLEKLKKEISVIRCLITLAGDHYYDSLFSNDYEYSKEQLEKAINEYHNKALMRQGIDPKGFKEYDYSKTLEIIEEANFDGASHVICLRAAGAYYLLYQKTNAEVKNAVKNHDMDKADKLKSEIEKYVFNQYLYLRAAYHYLTEACSDDKGNGLDTVKLEINSREIDNLFKDCESKYIYSFPLMKGKLKEEGIDLLQNVVSLYKALHVHSDVNYLYTETDNYHVIRKYNKDQKVRIEFPPYEKDRKSRIEKQIRSAEKWSRSEQIVDLLWVFGLKIDRELPFNEYITELNQLVDAWDFRGRMNAKKGEVDTERFDLEDKRFWTAFYPDLYKTISDNRELINSAATSLGMDDLGDIHGIPDYIIPVGGARMVNLFRPKMARKIIDDNGWKDATVVAIGASRPIKKKKEAKGGRKLEWYYTKSYAPKAKTEYDALTSGMCEAFGIKSYTETEYNDVSHDDVTWKSMRIWSELYNCCCITAISAPSITNYPKRANTYDGFLHFIKKFSPETGANIIMITTNIYCQYQGLSLMDIAMDRGWDVSVIGTDRSIEEVSFGGDPIKYLQELKATVNLIYKFTHPDPNNHCEKYGLSPSYIDDVKEVMDKHFSR